VITVRFQFVGNACFTRYAMRPCGFFPSLHASLLRFSTDWCVAAHMMYRIKGFLDVSLFGYLQSQKKNVPVPEFPRPTCFAISVPSGDGPGGLGIKSTTRE
jgi:hypothetical protein